MTAAGAHLSYRPEIDGLRAFAIVPVVLYHAKTPFFSGGFIGVDLFFVVSGYLICSIILREIDAGRFSYLRFYERRARRILPALFVMMLATVPLTFLLMSPKELKDFAQSLVATSLFSSNIQFWRETGYFEPEAAHIPLLHTWSLAVEEQFYLFFPPLLMLIWAFVRKSAVAILASLALASLALTLIFPEAASAHFYLLPSRAWELFAGCIAAIYVFRRGLFVSEWLGALGFAMVLAGLTLFDASTPHPSPWTAIPVLGCAIVLVTASTDTVVGKLLALRPLVMIGLISYSVYLWHHPILVYAEAIFGHAHFIPASILASFVIGFLSWRFVEQPFRNQREIRSTFSARSVWTICAGASAVFIGIGVFGHLSDGFRDLYLRAHFNAADRVVAQVFLEEADYNFNRTTVDDGACKFRIRRFSSAEIERFETCAKEHGPAIAIAGDSHGLNVYNMAAKADVGPFVVGFVELGCRAHPNKRECQYADLMEFLDTHANQLQAIFYHQSGSYLMADSNGALDSDVTFAPGESYEIRVDLIEKTHAFLVDLASKAPTFWLGPFTEARVDLSRIKEVVRERRINPLSIERFGELDEKITGLVSGVEYVSLVDAFSLGPQSLTSGNCLMFRDKDHFSRCGEDRLAGSLGDVLLRALAGR